MVTLNFAAGIAKGISDGVRTMTDIQMRQQQMQMQNKRLEQEQIRIDAMIEQGDRQETRLAQQTELQRTQIGFQRIQAMQSMITPQERVQAAREPDGPMAQRIAGIEEQIKRERESLNLLGTESHGSAMKGTVRALTRPARPQEKGVGAQPAAAQPAAAQPAAGGESSGGKQPAGQGQEQAPAVSEMDLAMSAMPGVAKYVQGGQVVTPTEEMAAAFQKQADALGIAVPITSRERVTEGSMLQAAQISSVMRNPGSPIRQSWEAADAEFDDDTGRLVGLPDDPEKVGKMVETLVAGVGEDEEGLIGVSTFVQQEVLPIILADPERRRAMFVEDVSGDLGGLSLPGVRPDPFAFGPQSTAILSQLAERDPEGFVQSGVRLMPMTAESFLIASERQARDLVAMSRMTVRSEGTQGAKTLSRVKEIVKGFLSDDSGPGTPAPGFEDKERLIRPDTVIGKKIRRSNLIMQSEFQRMFGELPKGAVSEDEMKLLQQYVRQFNEIHGYVPDIIEGRMTGGSEDLIESLATPPSAADMKLSDEDDAMLEKWLQESQNFDGGR